MWLGLTLAVAGCGETNLVKDAAVAVGIGGEPRAAPDFVARSRPGSSEYLPVGQSAPKRNLQAKDAGRLAQAEAEMDAARNANEARGTAARNAAASAAAAEPAPVRPRAPAQ
jgi:hypothetical protein